jgi:hypothetical protein
LLGRAARRRNVRRGGREGKEGREGREGREGAQEEGIYKCAASARQPPKTMPEKKMKKNQVRAN